MTSAVRPAWSRRRIITGLCSAFRESGKHCSHVSDRLQRLPCCRCEPLAAGIIPVLELYGDRIVLDYEPYGAQDIDDEPEAQPSLPDGFRALWLRTGTISMGNPEHAGGSVPASKPGVDVVDELCRFMSLAPSCYRQFRFLTSSGQPALSIEAAERLPHSARHQPSYFDAALSLADFTCEALRSSHRSFDSLQAVAAAMQTYADARGLVVSVADDQTHVHVDRVDHCAVL